LGNSDYYISLVVVFIGVVYLFIFGSGGFFLYQLGC